MRLDGSFGQTEPSGGLPCGHSLGGETEDLPFAGGEGRRHPSGLPSSSQEIAELREGQALLLGSEGVAAGGESFDRFRQPVDGELFDAPPDAVAKGSKRVIGALGAGGRQDPDPRSKGSETPGHLEPIDVREVQVEHQDVGMQPEAGRHGLLPGGDLLHDLDSGMRFSGQAGHASEDGMVVCNHYLDGKRTETRCGGHRVLRVNPGVAGANRVTG